MTALVALHPAVPIAPQPQYSWFVRRGELKEVDDAHRQEGVPPLATTVRRILHEHLDVALAGSAEAWEDERLYHLTAAAHALALLGRLNLTTEAEAMGEQSTWTPSSRGTDGRVQGV